LHQEDWGRGGGAEELTKKEETKRGSRLPGYVNENPFNTQSPTQKKYLWR
jgi:hypothetical protein